MSGSNPKSEFLRVNGVRLHYLDWGGSGPTLIFLTGMGSSAYIFNQFAPRFTDRWIAEKKNIIPTECKHG
jgi:pimeloyl-ACP methyl ester carboxylesterase